MKKEDVNLLAQLLTGIKDALDKLEESKKKGDMERLASAKREILGFQKQIDKLL